MMRPKPTLGTLYWGVILIALGGVFLLRNLGYDIPIWRTVAVYWPVLIIVWGLVKLLERLTPSGRRRPLFSGGEVALLILVILGGALFTFAANISSNLEFLGVNLAEDLDLFDILGENFEFESTLEAGIAPGRMIEIENAFGGVEVGPGDDDRITVAVGKTIRAGSRDEAAQLEDELSFSIEDAGGVVRVVSNREDLSAWMRQRIQTRLTVRVPRESNVRVRNHNGRVSIVSLAGEAEVINRYGATEIESVEGAVRVETRNGPLSVSDAAGSVVASNAYGDSRLTNIAGSVQVETRFGDLAVSAVAGDLTVDARYTDVSARDIAGAVVVAGRNNAVAVAGAQGAVRIETTYRDIVVSDAPGPIEVTSHHGDVRIEAPEAMSGNIAVRGDYSNVALEFPRNAAFSLDLQTRFGSLDSDFDVFQSAPTRREQRAVGRVGEGGPHIEVQLDRGDVRLEAR